MAESSCGLAQRIRHLAQVKALGWRGFAEVAVISSLLLVIGPAPSGGQPPSPAIDTSPSHSSPTSASAVTPSPAETTSKVAPPDATSKPKAELVEIEAKFVELSGKALEDMKEALPTSLVRSDNLRIASILENDQFAATIRSLNHIKGVDLLMAPRVATRSGQRAVVEVIREFRYPNEFEPLTDGSGRAHPTAFETRNTGVTVEICPVVTPGNRIETELFSSVVEFAGFVNYGTGRPPRKTLKGDALVEMMKPVSTKHIINQPIFDTRRITTHVTLKSGQTVLLGGLSRRDIQNGRKRLCSICLRSRSFG